MAGAQTISVTTRLVEVSVVVEDRKGQPVTDLTQADFEILEDGKPQTIRFFFKDAAASAGPAAEPLPPNVFSNRGRAGEARPTRLTVLLFDALNTPWQYRNYAARHMDRFLKAASPEERVTVLLLSGNGLRLLHNDQRIRLPKLREDALLGGEAETSAEQRQADMVLHDRIRLTLRALEVVAQNLAGVPGRKSLVWVTGGIPRQLNLYEPPSSLRDRASYSSEYAQAIRALNRASVSIYAVDARGLFSVHNTDIRFEPQDRWTPPKIPTEGLDQATEGMRDLAAGTGGRVYLNRNDLDRSMTEAAADGRVSYTLAYHQPGEADGKWRRIAVRVKRSGVTARHRAGYVAIDEEQDRDGALRRALASPLDAAGIGINGAVEREGTRPGNEGAWRALLQIDPANVSFTPKGDGHECRLEIVTLVRDEAGKTLGKPELDVVDLPLDRINGVLFRKRFEAERGAFEVRFGLRDPRTGVVATLSIPLGRK